MADYVIAADWHAVAVPRWFEAPLSWNEATSLVGINDWRAVAVARRITAALASAADQDLSFDWLASTVAKWFTAAEDWNDATSLVGVCHYDVRALVFKMRGMDAAIGGLYDTWLSSSPDLRAQSYTGALARPLRDVCVIDVWDGAPSAAPATKGIVMPDTLIVLRVFLGSTEPRQLTTEATPVKTTAFIKADPANTSGVALISNGSGTPTTGLLLAPGDQAVAEIDDLSKLWFVAVNPGQAVAVTASQ